MSRSRFPRHRRLIFEALERRLVLAAYMKFGDIKGDVVEKGHKNEIEIYSWEWITVPPPVPGAPARVSDVVVAKRMDSASVKLQEAVAKGQVFGSVEFHFFATAPSEKPQKYLDFKLERVIVTGYQSTGFTDGVPMEQVTLDFTEVQTTYKAQDRKGQEPGGGRTYVNKTDEVDARGPDLNGDGTADPLFFNYASLVDFNQDGLAALVVADLNGDRLPDNDLPADLNGDELADLIDPLGDDAVPADLSGDGLFDRNVPVDFDGDEQVDPLFPLDVDNDLQADWLAELRAGAIPLVLLAPPTRGRGR